MFPDLLRMYTPKVRTRVIVEVFDKTVADGSSGRWFRHELSEDEMSPELLAELERLKELARGGRSHCREISGDDVRFRDRFNVK